jgi:hypothetical protein
VGHTILVAAYYSRSREVRGEMGYQWNS